MNYKDIKIDLEVIINQLDKKNKTSTWKGRIISIVGGSKTKVVVKDTERGVGWNESIQKYKGITNKGGWQLGKNYDFSSDSIVHRKDIEKIVE